jgi:hypothetical protein
MVWCHCAVSSMLVTGEYRACDRYTRGRKAYTLEAMEGSTAVTLLLKTQLFVGPCGTVFGRLSELS